MLDSTVLEKEVRQNILPFWAGLTDTAMGGYYGEADFYGQPRKKADKGCILHSRLLWAFSAAYRCFGAEVYRKNAEQAWLFLTDFFWDKKYGGLYWQVDYMGVPTDTIKHFYSIAFGIYAFSEHFRATGRRESLNLALDLFDVTEKHGYDLSFGGYAEACYASWASAADNRLGGQGVSYAKSMNTHLHILEAYTNLLRACGGSAQGNPVRYSLAGLLRVMTEKIYHSRHHFGLYFDRQWQRLTEEKSYGHDIEGSWLLYDAALALGGEWPSRIKALSLAIAEELCQVALDRETGGLLSGISAAGQPVAKKEWWAQAEAVVGFYHAWELSGDKKFYDAAVGLWAYIERYFIDRQNGEWYNALNADHTPDPALPKAGFWKCPYHNSRMCFQLWERITTQAKGGAKK